MADLLGADLIGFELNELENRCGAAVISQGAGRRVELEVCVDRVEDAILAVEAGATRIEINTALDLFGLTPPPASCAWLKENCQVPIVAMLRPHNRGFYYSSSEQLECLRDCEHLLAAGVDGIVFGSLTEKKVIDTEFLKQIVALCANREVIYHRAFDKLSDQLGGLRQLVDCGVARVLTSGGAINAPAGVERLRELQAAAAGSIEILPGGGVNSENARDIVIQTGCLQLHGSFRNGNYRSGRVDSEDIQRTRKILEEQAGATEFL